MHTVKSGLLKKDLSVRACIVCSLLLYRGSRDKQRSPGSCGPYPQIQFTNWIFLIQIKQGFIER